MTLRLRVVTGLLCALGLRLDCAAAHDVPNRFFDRAVQVAVEPGKVHVLYDLSISELTLAEELMALVGPDGLAELPSDQWLERFAREMAELLAQGLLLEANGSEVQLRVLGFSYDTHEGHPRFRFRFDGPLPPAEAGDELKLYVEDTNFFLERGSVRMALYPLEGTELRRSSVPWTVDEVPVRPGWEMTPEEADAARRIEAELRFVRTDVEENGPAADAGRQAIVPLPAPVEKPENGNDPVLRLRHLLAPTQPAAMIAALLAAFGLGAAHALTPGHGKTVAAAFLVAQRASLAHAVGLAATVVVTHTGAVFAAAAVLAIVDPALDRVLGKWLSMASGLLVIGVGSLLLAGRLLSLRKQTVARKAEGRASGWLGIAGIGAAAGLVPCWDGVALVLWAIAVGRSAWGLVLLTAFTLGLGAVLVGIAVAVVKLPRFVGLWSDGADRFGRYISIAAALVIVLVGCMLTWQAWSS